MTQRTISSLFGLTLIVFLMSSLATEAVGQRWGIPGGKSSSGSPDWTLNKPRQRPTYSNSRSSAPRYDASLNGRGRSYTVAPPRTQYSRPPHRGHYRHQPPPVQPYVNFFYNGIGDYNYLGPYSQQYLHGGYGIAPSYPTISAPPIVIPYGARSSATYQRVPYGSSVIGSYNVVPAPNVNVVPPSIPPATTLDPQMVPDPQQSRTFDVDERPMTNEFEAATLNAAAAPSAVDKLRSLRYQTSGDDAFRRSDYASAAALYEAAADTASNRRAPVLRQVWANIAMEDFPEAIAKLKKVLAMPADPTNAWIAAADLYPTAELAKVSLQNDALWDWVQQRPNSTDRLLLGAAFQLLQEHSGAARELLRTAQSLGLAESTVRSMYALADSAERPQAVQPAAADGIRMKGDDLITIPQSSPKPDTSLTPVPLPDDEDDSFLLPPVQ